VAVVYSLRHPAAVPLQVRRDIVDATANLQTRCRPHPDSPEERLQALQEMQRFARNCGARDEFVTLFGLRCRVIDIAAGRPKDLEVIAELEVIREERGA